MKIEICSNFGARGMAQQSKLLAALPEIKPRFDFQHSHGASQPYVILVPRASNTGP